MNITQIKIPTTNYSGSHTVKSGIVLHWMDGTLAGADARFTNPKSQVSAHYGIADTTIHQYVQENQIAYHAGNWPINESHIGIEHQGSPTLPISEATYQTSIQLVADICKRWNIPCDRNHIIKHNQVIATSCPGTLDVDRIVREAALLINNSDMPTIHRQTLMRSKRNTDVRSAPKIDPNNIIASMPANTDLTPLTLPNVDGDSVNGNPTWIQLTYNGKTGYVCEDAFTYPSDVTPTPTPPVVVKATSATLDPSTQLISLTYPK